MLSKHILMRKLPKLHKLSHERPQNLAAPGELSKYPRMIFRENIKGQWMAEKFR